jgi:hypothetical protein
MTNAKSLLGVLAMVCILLATAGCASSGNVNASLGQEFTLAVGQTASISNEQLKIKFVQVIGDSRCPAGVECFWQGEATCKLEITYHDATDTKVLTQPGLTQGPWYADYGDFRIQFNLQPYPEERKQIAEKDYRLKMAVNR